MDVNDEDLARRAGAGDGEAFRVLLERHYDRMFRLAWRIIGQREDAEDIAQDVAIGLAGKIKGWRGDARFTTWLYTVVLNAARDHMRRTSARRRLAETYGEVAALVAAGEADALQRRNWMYGTLEEMGEEFRETAILVLAEGLSHAEAGHVLGVKEATVSWRLHVIRKRLKEILSESQ